ncbi:MAG: hypothetical protein ABWY14_14160 [Tardiphaga sp.]
MHDGPIQACQFGVATDRDFVRLAGNGAIEAGRCSLAGSVTIGTTFADDSGDAVVIRANAAIDQGVDRPAGPSEPVVDAEDFPRRDLFPFGLDCRPAGLSHPADAVEKLFDVLRRGGCDAAEAENSDEEQSRSKAHRRLPAVHATGMVYWGQYLERASRRAGSNNKPWQLKEGSEISCPAELRHTRDQDHAIAD